jgi:hypothetical protein
MRFGFQQLFGLLGSGEDRRRQLRDGLLAQGGIRLHGLAKPTSDTNIKIQGGCLRTPERGDVPCPLTFDPNERTQKIRRHEAGEFT